MAVRRLSPRDRFLRVARCWYFVITRETTTGMRVAGMAGFFCFDIAALLSPWLADKTIISGGLGEWECFSSSLGPAVEAEGRCSPRPGELCALEP